MMGSRKRKLLLTEKGEPLLKMECDSEELSPAQVKFYRAAEDEYVDFCKKYEYLLKGETLVDKGKFVTLFELTSGVQAQTTQVATSSSLSTLLSPPVNQSNVQMIVDPNRLPMFVHKFPQNVKVVPSSSTSATTTTPTVFTPVSPQILPNQQQIFRGPGPRGKTQAWKSPPQAPGMSQVPRIFLSNIAGVQKIQIPKKTQESETVGGLMMGPPAKRKRLIVPSQTVGWK